MNFRYILLLIVRVLHMRPRFRLQRYEEYLNYTRKITYYQAITIKINLHKHQSARRVYAIQHLSAKKILIFMLVFSFFILKIDFLFGCFQKMYYLCRRKTKFRHDANLHICLAKSVMVSCGEAHDLK